MVGVVKDITGFHIEERIIVMGGDIDNHYLEIKSH